MLFAHRVLWVVTTGVAFLCAVPASGQDPSTGSGQAYPNKPIRVITSEAGGGNDFSAREIARGISGPLGRPVTVENRQAGVVPGEIVSKAPPDGHTLLVYNNTVWIGPLLQSASYDAVKDFAPIVEAARTPNVLMVNSSSPATSVAELIALAKARPGALRYGVSGNGAANHMAGELFGAMAGIRIVHVVFKGAGASIKALLDDEMQLMFLIPVSAKALVKSGKMRALGVTSAAPSALMPGVPPVADSGLPGYESIVIFGAFAPAATPRNVIDRLNSEIVRFLTRPEVKERLFNFGLEIDGGSPEQFFVTVRSELLRMGKVIKDAGIRVE